MVNNTKDATKQVDTLVGGEVESSWTAWPKASFTDYEVLSLPHAQRAHQQPVYKATTFNGVHDPPIQKSSTENGRGKPLVALAMNSIS